MSVVAHATAAGLLRGRLAPPRLPAVCVRRDVVLRRIVDALDGPLTLIWAGAGFGKTVLLAQLLEGLPGPWAWCSCDERLDPGLLVAHVTAGIANQVPGFGEGVRFDGDPQEQVLTLANEIAETCPDRVFVVLDDVHLLPAESRAALEILVHDSPPSLHLVIAGRGEPIRVGARLSMQATRIGERELAFEDSDRRDVAACTGGTVDEELLSLTEGWAAGLVMLRQALQAGLPASAVQQGAFEYLATEVFAAQPEETRRFLVATSVLDRFTPAVAAAVSGMDDSAARCQELVQRGLFLSRGSDVDWYRYHHLFREFLRTHLGPLGSDAVRELHRRAARAWEEAGDPHQAVDHWFDADEPRRAAELIAELAEPMLLTPGIRTVDRWLGRLPEEEIASRPALVLAQGTVALEAMTEQSAIALAQTTGRLLELGDHERAAIALYRLTGSVLPEGLGLVEPLFARVSRDAVAYPAAQAHLATCYGWVGRYDDAERCLQEALAAPVAAAIPALRPYVRAARGHFVLGPTGHLDQAIVDLTEAVGELELLGTRDDVFGFIIWATAFRGFSLSFAGRDTETLIAADRMEQHARERGLSRLARRPISWMRMIALAGLDRWDDLEALLETIRPDLERLGHTAIDIHTRALMCKLAAARGDEVLLAGQVAASLHSMDTVPDQRNHPWLLTELAAASQGVGHTARATELAERACRVAHELRMPLEELLARLVLAYLTLDTDIGREALNRSLAMTKDGGMYALWASRARRFAIPLLARAMADPSADRETAAATAAVCGGEVFTALLAGDLPKDARVLLLESADRSGVVLSDVAALQDTGDVELQTAATAATERLSGLGREPLRFVTFGDFRVIRGQHQVPDGAFGRAKARALLAALLVHEHPVQREVLLEWFWPDLDPDRAARAFHVTLHALRQALEPGQGRGATGSMIEQTGGAYRLTFRDGDSCDLTEFLAATRTAHTTDAIRRALSLHTGPPFPVWSYEPWIEETLRRVSLGRVELLARLAGISLREGRPGEAAGCYHELLDADPEREEWHRGLMTAYRESGELGRALRQYHACRAVLRRGIGTEPSEPTRLLYMELLREQPAAA